MDDKKLLTRGQFLGIIGGIAATVVFVKFSGSKKALSGILANKSSTSNTATGYGNTSYGGKQG